MCVCVDQPRREQRIGPVEPLLRLKAPVDFGLGSYPDNALATNGHCVLSALV